MQLKKYFRPIKIVDFITLLIALYGMALRFPSRLKDIDPQLPSN